MKFPLLAIFMLFIVWLTYNKARTEKIEKKQRDAFWEKEAEANTTRRKDISLLPYIHIPLEDLPFGIRPQDDQLSACETRIRELSDLRILNLTGKTNTDLKLAYGAPNLTLLMEYDQNFTELARTMQQWGSRLYELCLTKEAQAVLTYAITWGSDIKGSYVLLARIFRETGNDNQLSWLTDRAGQLSSLRKDSILKALAELS